MATTSQQGIRLIKSFESLRLQAYRCPAGVLTIGYGHTAGVQNGDRIDESEAEQLLAADLQSSEALVNRLCPELNQNQFDALVSFGDTAGYDKLLSIMKDRSAVKLKYGFAQEAANDTYEEGLFVITSIEQTSSAAEDATYSATFENTGEVKTSTKTA